MSIDKNFQFTKKSVDGRMRAPKIVKAQKTYENNGACEACGAVITKGSYVLTANEVSGSKWSHDMRTVKTHRLCASCTAEYIKATSGVSVEEPKTYAQKQAQWIKENNVTVGTKVRVTRTFTEDEDGSCCFAHDDLVGETGVVSNIAAFNLGINVDGGYFKAVPYFALEVIKEPTYAERQTEWVKENNVKVGTKVRFTKGFDADEDGSGCCEHRDAKGKEGFINEVFNKFLSVVLGGDCWMCPFTSLEVIKEPIYRPYNNDELNSLVGKVLIQKGCEYPCLVTHRYSMTQVYAKGYLYTARQLLELFTLDGEPCGVKES